MFIPLDILSFIVLSHTFSQIFNKIIYSASKEFFLTCTCVRYLEVHVTDTESSGHMYWSDTASQTALQLPREDGRTSALPHIITDITRYTEHTADKQRNQA